MESPRPLDLLARLIAFDTTSRNSNLDLIGFAQDVLAQAGARVRLTHDAGGRKANLFASLGPAGDGGIVLSGHTDVVPIDGQDWSSDPFVAEMRDGRVYGRGSADMKGFIAAVLALVPEIPARELTQPIHVALSFDEEVGCVGVRALLEDLMRAGIKPALAIIGEPTSMRVVGGHKAGAVIETIAKGREGHSSAPDKGANAVMMAGEFIAMLSHFGAELKARQDPHFDPPYTTLQANIVAGGTAANVLAREAAVTWEYRALPDQDADAIVKEAESRAERTILPAYRKNVPEARFTTRVRAAYPGLVRDPHSPAVALAAAITGDNEVRAVSYGTEAGLFQRAGIPAVICGPGSIDQAHRADEFVDIAQIEACVAFLRKVMQRAAE